MMLAYAKHQRALEGQSALRKLVSLLAPVPSCSWQARLELRVTVLQISAALQQRSGCSAIVLMLAPLLASKLGSATAGEGHAL